MPGVPRELAEHQLKVILGSKPVKQGLRHFDGPRRKATGKEIIRLLAADFIREVIHTDYRGVSKTDAMGMANCWGPMDAGGSGEG